MIDFHLILEKDKLVKAVDLFAAELTKRLVEQAVAGKRGWNKPILSEPYVVRELWNDATDLEQAIATEKSLTPKCDPQLIDIANRCMILWFRHNVGIDVVNP